MLLKLKFVVFRNCKRYCFVVRRVRTKRDCQGFLIDLGLVFRFSVKQFIIILVNNIKQIRFRIIINISYYNIPTYDIIILLFKLII